MSKPLSINELETPTPSTCSSTDATKCNPRLKSHLDFGFNLLGAS